MEKQDLNKEVKNWLGPQKANYWNQRNSMRQSIEGKENNVPKRQ